MLDNEGKKHLKRITESIDELKGFNGRTKDPNPVTHQYIGVIVDNTLGFLCSAANSLDKGRRVATFDQMKNWTSLMRAVHQSFFSTLHIAIEAALEDLCTKLSVTAKSSERGRYLKIIKKINENEDHKNELSAYFEKRKPSFDDKVDAILKSRKLEEQKKTTWRKFFKAITILRNKASHPPNPKLSEPEIQSLRDGGFDTCVSKNGELQANPRMYAQIVKYVLDFFDEANQSP